MFFLVTLHPMQFINLLLKYLYIYNNGSNKLLLLLLLLFTPVIWRAFWRARVQKFSRLLNKFEVWVSWEAVCDILFGFSVWFFRMEFKHLPYLLNTGFTINEIGLFYGGEHLEAKLCNFQTFWDNMAICIKDERRVKTLQMLVEFC